jgi:hypothetical protein
MLRAMTKGTKSVWGDDRVKIGSSRFVRFISTGVCPASNWEWRPIVDKTWMVATA